MKILEVTRKLIELVKNNEDSDRIIFDALVNYGGEVCKLNINLTLVEDTKYRFNLRYTLETSENRFTGKNIESNFWNVYNKATDRDYTYMIGKSFQADAKNLIIDLKNELISQL